MDHVMKSVELQIAILSHHIINFSFLEVKCSACFFSVLIFKLVLLSSYDSGSEN